MSAINASQAETLRRVLAAGGNVGVTQGSLKKRPGYVQKVQAVRMIEAGLLEYRDAGRFDRMFRPGSHRPGGLFATAKGCIALHEFETALAVTGETQ